MDNKPSLSQYFGETEVPPASQFFDEIGTSPSDMIQSVYLGESEVSQPSASNLFSTNMTASFTKVPDDMKFATVVPTVSGTTALPATSLPDPSTFFDTIGPEPQMAMSGIATPNILTEAMDGLSVKDQPVDKEADRRRDAWIPNEEAKKVLLKAQSSPKGAFFPEREALTLPGVIFEDELPDALHAVAVKYLGVSAAGRGGVARAEHCRDAAGLRELLRTGCLRAALNVTRVLLAQHKQGMYPALHTSSQVSRCIAEHCRDAAGLRELLRTGCLRAALNVTRVLLAQHKQGMYPALHTSSQVSRCIAEHCRDAAGLRELLRTGCLRAALNVTRVLLAQHKQGMYPALHTSSQVSRCIAEHCRDAAGLRELLRTGCLRAALNVTRVLLAQHKQGMYPALHTSSQVSRCIAEHCRDAAGLRELLRTGCLRAALNVTRVLLAQHKQGMYPALHTSSQVSRCIAEHCRDAAGLRELLRTGCLRAALNVTRVLLAQHKQGMYPALHTSSQVSRCIAEHCRDAAGLRELLRTGCLRAALNVTRVLLAQHKQGMYPALHTSSQVSRCIAEHCRDAAGLRELLRTGCLRAALNVTRVLLAQHKQGMYPALHTSSQVSRCIAEHCRDAAGLRELLRTGCLRAALNVTRVLLAQHKQGMYPALHTSSQVSRCIAEHCRDAAGLRELLRTGCLRAALNVTRVLLAQHKQGMYPALHTSSQVSRCIAEHCRDAAGLRELLRTGCLRAALNLTRVLLAQHKQGMYPALHTSSQVSRCIAEHCRDAAGLRELLRTGCLRAALNVTRVLLAQHKQGMYPAQHTSSQVSRCIAEHCRDAAGLRELLRTGCLRAALNVTRVLLAQHKQGMYPALHTSSQVSRCIAEHCRDAAGLRELLRTGCLRAALNVTRVLLAQHKQGMYPALHTSSQVSRCIAEHCRDAAGLRELLRTGCLRAALNVTRVLLAQHKQGMYPALHTSSQVSRCIAEHCRDAAGLRELLRTGCLRAALNVTRVLLAQHKQGMYPALHTSSQVSRCIAEHCRDAAGLRELLRTGCLRAALNVTRVLLAQHKQGMYPALHTSSQVSRCIAEHCRDAAGLRELLRTGCLRAALNVTRVLLAQHKQGMYPALHTSSQVSRCIAEHCRDAAGLRELLRTGCLRAALNVTRVLLAQHKQGAGRAGRTPGARHSARSLQLWLARFCVLLRIRMPDVAAQEAAAFGDCGKPDMYYEFYPDQYEGRTGSLVPFALRLLIAEMPAHAGQPERALPRLYAMLAVVQQMLANLNAGKTEDGSAVLSSEQDRSESIRLWSGRETRVQHSIVNCAIALKDYRLASKIVQGLQEKAASSAQQRALASALCRLWLLAGHCRAAAAHLQTARELRQQQCPTPDVREYVDLGLLEIAQGRYQDAYSCFARAADQEPTNIMVANNLSVCLLYMGRLKEAIAVLQKAINSAPERGLSEHLLLNLCTLYELESSKNTDKKLNLLRMLCQYKSDTMPDVAECLKLA